MPTEIIVPPLSQTADSIVLAGWLKQPGEPVVKGEPLFVVETDKATLEVEAPASGVLAEVRAAAGAEVAVRSVIGLIATAEDAAGAVGPAAGPEAVGGRPLRVLASPRARRLARAEGVDLAGVPATGPRGMRIEADVRGWLAAHSSPAAVKATPVARRLAELSGVDLAAVQPADPGGRIVRADVEAVLEAESSKLKAGGSTPEAGSLQPEAAGSQARPASTAGASTEVAGTDVRGGVAMSATRRTIARRMSESWRNAPQVTLTREVDATALVELRALLQAEVAATGPEDQAGPSITALLASIVVRCLRVHPALNAFTDGERIELRPEIHLAVAVDTPRGLVAPVVRDADTLGLLALSGAITSAVASGMDGTATQEAYQGGTFTLTNLGPQGIDAFTPIVNPPQVAILGIGRIRPAPAVYEGQVCVRQLTVLSLTFDHRAVDGAPAARFLADVAARIERPHLVWL